MIISIQRGMSSLKARLEQRGHKLVYADAYPHPVDAYIYSGHGVRGAYSDIQDFSSSTGIGSAIHGTLYQGGVIEINAAGKSVDDIEAIIMKKRQTNLF